MSLYEFYGETCPHCEAMEPVVDEVEEEEDVDIVQLEVWNDQENAEKQQELDDGKCGGVPFFYNTETDEWICGEAEKEKLARWANGEALNE
jgi:thiol-disulfide isomerase/thioredoxin